MKNKNLFEEIDRLSKEIEKYHKENTILKLYLIDGRWQPLPEHMIVVSD